MGCCWVGALTSGMMAVVKFLIVMKVMMQGLEDGDVRGCRFTLDVFKVDLWEN